MIDYGLRAKLGMMMLSSIRSAEVIAALERRSANPCSPAIKRCSGGLCGTRASMTASPASAAC
ncbi:MAG TPA: hypothetical protein VIJ64_01910 [Candidatus Lustribacter sp.]